MNVYEVVYDWYYHDAEWKLSAHVVSKNEVRAAALFALAAPGLPFDQTWRFVHYEVADKCETEESFLLRAVNYLGPAVEGATEGVYSKAEALTLLDKEPETLGEYLERYPNMSQVPLDEQLRELLEGIRAARCL